jgi:hypothetical protein
MTGPDVPAGDDYGYDLAHDVPRARPAPAEPGERRTRRPVPPPGPGAAEGDLGYDEAHDRG